MISNDRFTVKWYPNRVVPKPTLSNDPSYLKLRDIPKISFRRIVVIGMKAQRVVLCLHRGEVRDLPRGVLAGPDKVFGAHHRHSGGSATCGSECAVCGVRGA